MGDDDSDGVKNIDDNCSATANVDQADSDIDGVGDACDNCIPVANTDQLDADGDGEGDVCKDFNSGTITDTDGDGMVDAHDNCPLAGNAGQEDSDGDVLGDSCDNCPLVTNPGQEDSDADGTGDRCDDSVGLDATNSCAESSTQANQIAANLYFVIDESLSMTYLACDTCLTREIEWENALPALASNLTDGRFNLGISRFSGGNADPANAACTSLPTQPLSLRDNATDAEFSSAASIAPNGSTPTAAALQGTRDPNRDGDTSDARWHLANDALDSQRAKAVILVTDGAPTRCPGSSGLEEPSLADPGGSVFPAVRATLTQALAIASEGVPVNLIGFAGVNEDLMQLIANAGEPGHPGPHQVCDTNGSTQGTPCLCANSFDGGNTNARFNPSGCTAFGNVPKATWYTVSNTQSILDAVNAIVRRTANCNLQIADTGLGTKDDTVTQVMLVEGAGSATAIPGADWTLSGTTIAIADAHCKHLSDLYASDPDARIEVRQGCACVPDPNGEQCGNLIDDDCDGLIDEDCGGPPEVCDGLDNDGDGETDEGCPARLP